MQVPNWFRYLLPIAIALLPIALDEPQQVEPPARPSRSAAPLVFEANHGQAGETAGFLARGSVGQDSDGGERTAGACP
jgi:hypothetical protein